MYGWNRSGGLLSYGATRSRGNGNAGAECANLASALSGLQVPFSTSIQDQRK